MNRSSRHLFGVLMTPRVVALAPAMVAMGLCILIALPLGGCSDVGTTTTGPVPLREMPLAGAGRDQARLTQFTGGVQLVWPGGQGASAPDAPGRVAEADMVAFPDVPAGDPGPGGFTYRVVDADGTIHREIQVELTWVGLEDQQVSPGEIRFIGVVTADTKPCGGQHDGGCTGEDGGCTHDDGGGCTGEDGGCTHDDGGGCTGEEGGCTHDDGGGCSGTGSTGEAGEPGGMGGSGDKVTGADCRIGQIVIGWALDGGTPAVNGDRISWKWFAPDAPKVTQILDALALGQPVPWPCQLCEKEILAGNLSLFQQAPDQSSGL